MTSAIGLGESARLIWGKAGDLSLGSLPLWRHLADSAGVAGRLWDLWLPASVKHRIASELPGGEDDGRKLVCWLAGIHDIGKATPAFAIQVRPLRNRMRDHGFAFDPRVEGDRRLAPHATAGHVILLDWLTERYGWDRAQAEQFAVVVGGHHGIPPTDLDIKTVRDHPYLLGLDGIWPEARADLLDWMARRVEVHDRLFAWRDLELSQPVQALLTAMVIVADWIASNVEFFPYLDRSGAAHERLQQAWDELDLPAPWRAVDIAEDTTNFFLSRFPLPQGAQPYPIQQAVADEARKMPLPGLLIVEAPMGEGKTEAALAAVEILAARSGAGGCFIALPTRATSDAMFSRVLSWLKRLPDADPDRGNHAVTLAHAKARLNTEFTQLYRHSLPRDIGRDDHYSGIGAHRWLAGRKKSLLSSFVIGTIDQLLFAALKARHVVLRHLGLAGKVVVIDEVHAYDVYMSAYLDRALEWLGAYGVPVVILSATLPARRRAELMATYDNGRLGRLRAKRRWSPAGADVSNAADGYRTLREDRRYPLLSISGVGREPSTRACDASSRKLSVQIEQLDDDLELLASLLRRELTGGGCVLVVRNTVARVQQTAMALREALGPEIPVSVAHSRFLAVDRAAKDRWLRDTFGPPGHLQKHGLDRPARHVVVASQVAEQSLDIDFDLIVTDLAPIDLLLQRMGRLHRHERSGRPSGLEKPRCYLTGAKWDATPPEPVQGSARVYDLSALLRAAAVLRPYAEKGQVLELPQDISPLVQEAYGDQPVGPTEWHPVMADAATRSAERMHASRQRAETFRIGPVRNPGRALVSWLATDVGDVESIGGDDRQGRAHVRDASAEGLEVLVLIRDGGKLVTPPWLAENGGVTVPVDFAPPPAVARTVATCALPLPRMMTANGGIDRIIDELEERNSYPAWQDSPWLGGELILDFDSRGRTTLAGFSLEYDPHDGLRVSRLIEDG